MREIKFRAWDKFRKKIVKNILTIKFDREGEPCLIVYTDKKIKGDLLEQDKTYCNEFNLLQYTGLVDKQGKEIYEGDILMGGVYLAYEVEWDNAGNGWNLGNEYNIKTYFEVIGNIYENPELLREE